MDIAQVLVEAGVISQTQADRARRHAPGKRIDHTITELGLATEESMLAALGREIGMDFVDIKNTPVDPEVLNKFPSREIFRHSLLPFRQENGCVYVATADPFDLEALDELGTATGQRLEPVLARREDIITVIKERLGVSGDTVGALVAQRAEEDIEYLEELDADDSDLAEQAQQASVIKLVNDLLTEAVEQRASDVHLEPHETGLSIRFRIDGVMRVQPMAAEIGQFQAAIISRLKIMSRLNIAEKRLPQDGRIKLKVNRREVDVRVSIIPMLHGEGVVMRLLDKSRMVFDLKAVGLFPDTAKVFHELIALPHGIVLVTGPTGSGKSTTLYSALNEIKSPETKIITVEDPVEYQMAGISQIQVHSKIGLTFAAGLRSILRHDPDVILIGEIRDGETANSAIQAALTGHTVFSTLHTNDAAGAFTRLVDMGVEPYLVASTVEGVLAQRLVRRLCEQCKEGYTPADDEIPADFPQPHPTVLYRPTGCRACRNTGYSGRMGIFELLRTDAEIQNLCCQRRSANELRNHALKRGLVTLRQDGYRKVAAGLTSLDEVIKITKGDLS
jgi:general secretion pathway protein E/type IV pilus assembly protein PilB